METQEQPISGGSRFWKRFFRVLGTLVLVGFLALLIFLCIFAVYVKNYLIPQAELSMEGFSLDQTTVIYYYDDAAGDYRELQKLYSSENRIWASYGEIPSDLVFAAIAIEDKRFPDHNGVDWLRTAKASVNMFFGDTTYGASTITQQLIKNLTKRDEVTVRRKMIEIFRALVFEKQYSKDEIMEWYLNTIYLGEDCYGVRSASWAYFGKDVSDLTLAECASLIGITNNPSLYDPYLSPENNIKRQQIILSEMLRQGYIDQAEYDEARAQTLDFHWGAVDENAVSASSSVYSYFVDTVIRDVATDLSAATGYSYDVAYQLVLSGGYSIYSTIDLAAQQELEAVYTAENALPKAQGTWQDLQSAMVVIDNASGDVVALVGGVGEKAGSLTFNRATQSYLSPGSAIKPLSVYAPALEQGLITPVTVYDDTPFTFTDTSAWPRNFDYTYRGLVSVRTAMEQSLNTVAVKIVDQLTPEACFSFAREKFRLTSLTASREINGAVYTDIAYSPMALGSLTTGVTVKAMAAAYAALADEGIYRTARTYTRVTDADGQVVLDNAQESFVAVSELTAWYLTDMMTGVVENGTGTDAALDTIPVAGKTGTTTSSFDRWFCGYTPYYTAAVWVGFDEPEAIVLEDGEPNPAGDLFRQVMQTLHQGKAVRSFDKPSSVVTCTVCADSGQLATQWCENDVRESRVVQAELALEDVPTQTCQVHVGVGICEDTGLVANDFCADARNNTVTYRGMLDVSRVYPLDGLRVQDEEFTVPESDPLYGEYYALPDTDSPANAICGKHSAHSNGMERTESEPEEEHEDHLPGGEAEGRPDNNAGQQDGSSDHHGNGPNEPDHNGPDNDRPDQSEGHEADHAPGESNDIWSSIFNWFN